MQSSSTNSTPLAGIKRLINRALAPLGIGIHKVPAASQDSTAVATVRLGNYSIQIPARNPLSTLYVQRPDYSGHLGRLTALIHQKYPAMSAIDIGANVGDTACIIKTAADVPLLCIEGDPFTFGFLEKNIAPLKETTAHRLFLGEKTGAINAAVSKSGWNTTIEPDAAAKEKVDIVKLDDFLADNPAHSSCKLLKVDTEGFDCPILRGAMDCIRQALPVISLEYNRENMNKIGEPGIDTLFLLGGLGYSHAAFHDSEARFICMARLDDKKLIGDLHDYADGKYRAGGIYYYDITLFSAADQDLAAQFAEVERSFRTHSGA